MTGTRSFHQLHNPLISNQIYSPSKNTLPVQQLTLQTKRKPSMQETTNRNSTKIHTPECTNTSNQTHVKAITDKKKKKRRHPQSTNPNYQQTTRGQNNTGISRHQNSVSRTQAQNITTDQREAQKCSPEERNADGGVNLLTSAAMSAVSTFKRPIYLLEVRFLERK